MALSANNLSVPSGSIGQVGVWAWVSIEIWDRSRSKKEALTWWRQLSKLSAKEPPSSYKRASELRYSFISSSLARRSWFFNLEILSSLSLSMFPNAYACFFDSSKDFFVKSNFWSWTTLQAWSSRSFVSVVSAFSHKQLTTISWDMQRSIRPLFMSTPCKNKKRRLEKGVTIRRKGEKDRYAYLCQTKKTCLLYGLGCMIAQVLVIIFLNDGQELLDCISQVFTEEDRVLFIDGTLTRHHTFSLPKTGRRRQLVWIRGLLDGWPRHHLGLFRKTIYLIWWLPFYEWVNWTRPLRRHALVLLLLHSYSSLLTDIGPPLTIFHLCIKRDGKKKLDKILEIKEKVWAMDLHLRACSS